MMDQKSTEQPAFYVSMASDDAKLDAPVRRR